VQPVRGPVRRRRRALGPAPRVLSEGVSGQKQNPQAGFSIAGSAQRKLVQAQMWRSHATKWQSLGSHPMVVLHARTRNEEAHHGHAGRYAAVDADRKRLWLPAPDRV